MKARLSIKGISIENINIDSVDIEEEFSIDEYKEVLTFSIALLNNFTEIIPKILHEKKESIE